MNAIFEVALPVFAILFAGYGAGRAGILGEEASEALNAFVYWVAFPPLLFLLMSRVEVASAFNGRFLAAYCGGVFATLATALLASRLVLRLPPGDQVLNGLNATFANTGYLGVPLVLTAYGEAAAAPAIVATLFNAIVLIGGSIVLCEVLKADASGPRHALRVVATTVLTSPLIVAPLAGLAVAALGFTVPTPVAAFCEIVGAAVAPCALFSIGLFLVGKKLRSDLGEIGWLTWLKLVVHPLVTWWIAFRLLPMDPVSAKATVVLSALPTGALAFVVAQRYGISVQRTGTTVVISTVLSVLTVSFLLALLEGAFL